MNLQREQLLKNSTHALFWQIIKVVGVQGIDFFRTLFLALLLAPDDFGMMAIVMVSINMLDQLTNIGLTPALIQKKTVSHEELDAAWTMSVLRAGLIAVILFFLAPFIAQAFQQPQVTNMIRLASLKPILFESASIQLVSLQREMKMKSISILYLINAMTHSLIAVLFAPFLGVWALVIGLIIGTFFYSLCSYVLAPHIPKLRFDFEHLGELLSFGKWIFLISTIAVASGFLLRMLISRQIGIGALGLFFLGSKLAFYPLGIAEELMKGVTFPLYSRMNESVEHLRKIFRLVLKGLYTVLIPCFMLVIVMIPYLIEYFLGQKWEGTIGIIRLLAVAGMISIFGLCLVPLLKGLGRLDQIFLIEITQSLAILCLTFLLIPSFNIYAVGIAYIIGVVHSLLFAMFFLSRIFSGLIGSIGYSLLLICLISSIGVAMAYGVVERWHSLLGFLVANVVGLTVTGMGYLLSDYYLGSDLLSGMSSAFPQLKRIKIMR